MFVKQWLICMSILLENNFKPLKMKVSQNTANAGKYNFNSVLYCSEFGLKIRTVGIRWSPLILLYCIQVSNDCKIFYDFRFCVVIFLRLFLSLNFCYGIIWNNIPVILAVRISWMDASFQFLGFPPHFGESLSAITTHHFPASTICFFL